MGKATNTIKKREKKKTKNKVKKNCTCDDKFTRWASEYGHSVTSAGCKFNSASVQCIPGVILKAYNHFSFSGFPTLASPIKRVTGRADSTKTLWFLK